MEKLPYYFTLVFFITGITTNFSQNTSYAFNTDYTTTQMNRYRKAPEVYTVINPGLYNRVNPVTRTGSNAYRMITTKINPIVLDSVPLNNSYNNSLLKVKELKRISQLINSFIANPKPFKVKKQYLIEAQVLANKHQIKEVIFADNLVNPYNKTKFRALIADKPDLLIQLKKVAEVSDLMAENSMASLNVNSYNNQIINSENRPDSIYNNKKIVTDLEKASYGRFKINNKINDISSITGNFDYVGKFYIMKMTFGDFIKDELVSKEDIIEFNIPKQFLKKGKQKILLRKSNTNELVMVEENYTKKFALKTKDQTTNNNLVITEE